jgi:hypothetical protein
MDARVHATDDRSSAPPPEAAPPPTGLDPILAAWLRAGPSACPRCRYDVSAATRPACPECGQTLRLRIDVADPATLPYAIILVLLALTPGLALLFLFGSVVNTLVQERRLGLGDRIPDFVPLGAIAVVPLLAWIAGRRRFVRLPPIGRRIALAGFGLIGVWFSWRAMRGL